MSIPKVGDIVESQGCYIGEITRIWEDGCVVDFQYEDNDDGSPCFGEEKVPFNEIRVINDPILFANQKMIRDREKEILSLWPEWRTEERNKIWEMRYKALSEDSIKKILEGLNTVIKLLSAMQNKS